MRGLWIFGMLFFCACGDPASTDPVDEPLPADTDDDGDGVTEN